MKYYATCFIANCCLGMISSIDLILAYGGICGLIRDGLGSSNVFDGYQHGAINGTSIN